MCTLNRDRRVQLWKTASFRMPNSVSLLLRVIMHIHSKCSHAKGSTATSDYRLQSSYSQPHYSVPLPYCLRCVDKEWYERNVMHLLSHYNQARQ